MIQTEHDGTAGTWLVQSRACRLVSEPLCSFECVLDDAVNMVFELLQTVGETGTPGLPDGTLIVGPLYAHRFVQAWGVSVKTGMLDLTVPATALPNWCTYGALDILCRWRFRESFGAEEISKAKSCCLSFQLACICPGRLTSSDVMCPKQ